ncbi:DUF917 domain-containing protein [Kordiimonas aquimaris]|uniref:DUF917 domain-containing protein n=1 Tax=Kordiimonas aquimaris TaxID=707591 RepID=UPI0021CF684E|nr:DUF917 domain-containing protein [Kordiimonas aquimaris]
MKQVNASDLDDLSLGSVFLATGGGGDPYVPQMITKATLEKYGPATMINAEDLADDAYVVALGGVGAPTVSLELLPSISESIETLKAFEAHVGRKVDAVVSFEIGGGNSLIPIAAAAGCDIPVVDGDGMGRALPEAQMMTYAIAGVKPTPAVAMDYAGNITTFTTPDTPTYERHIRSLAMVSGGMIVTGEHPMTGAELKPAIIPGTVSFSIALGKVLRENRGRADEMLPHLQALFGASIYGECRMLHVGKVSDKATRIVGGYDVGQATISGFDEEGPSLHITIKNEYLLAERDGKVVASVPDLIVIVDYETGTPINAERLRYGQRVAVFAVGCPAYFRSEKALKAVAPRAFGFDVDYVPLEDIPHG